MQKKFQVFVSSTYQDLIVERQDAIKSILDLGHIPSGMEAFHAADLEQFEYIKKVTDECDYYVLIIGGRYGSTNSDGISYTELEYEYALNTGKTILAFLHTDDSNIPEDKCDSDPALLEKLQKFREKVSTRRLVSFWTAQHDLKATVIISLSKAFSDYPGTGWMRASAVASEDVLAQLNQLRTENDELVKRVRLSNSIVTIPDLATIDDIFTIQYNYKTSFDSRSSQNSIELSWKSIFSIVGPKFLTPAWATTISGSIEGYIKRKGSSYRVDIGSDVTMQIRAQLELLGLIHFYTSMDEGKVSGEAGQLTDMGKATLMELLAVRKGG